jgi:hypothetical protein
MSKPMKIMIAYDGSPCADIALRDLERAGLPREVQAMVLSVADVQLIPADTEARTPDHISPIMQQAHATAARIMDEAQTIAARGRKQCRKPSQIGTCGRKPVRTRQHGTSS